MICNIRLLGCQKKYIMCMYILGDMLYVYCLISWSPGIKWSPGAIVKWDGDTFKAEGDIQNVALPGNSSHEGFYVSKCFMVCAET